VRAACERAIEYLRREQAADGSWTALWFGSQVTNDHANRVLGTARVLRSLEEMEECHAEAQRALAFVLSQQNADGGWGAAKGVPSSVEETAQVISALAGWPGDGEVTGSRARGVQFLLRAVASGKLDNPSPIGLYFARLWYFEKLYPLIWTIEALGRTIRLAGRE
jgi:squalene-hopene/tetraprenyl-beta-curcumene cyclase